MVGTGATVADEVGAEADEGDENWLPASLRQRWICRTACRRRASFSTSDIRKKPSPAGPKPLPGLTATLPFSKSIMPKSMVLMRERHGSGIGTQQNMLAFGGVTGQPIRCRLSQSASRRL